MRALLFLAVSLPLAAQVPGDVEFRLEATGGRTRFQTGETIPLELVYQSTSSHKYTLSRLRIDQTDEVLIEPVAGTVDPLRDYFSGLFGIAGSGAMTMLGTQPSRVERELNERVRFEKPGRYRVTVLSRRVSLKFVPGQPQPPAGPLELKSNSVEITILPPDPEWQAAELQRATQVLESLASSPDSNNFDMRRDAARKIRFLNTPAAVRESVTRYPSADPQLDSEFRFSLLGTTHRQLAVEAMEAALRDPHHPISADFVDTLAKMKTWLEVGPLGPYPPAGPEQARWQERQKQAQAREAQTRMGLTEALAAAAGRKVGTGQAASLLALVDLAVQARREVPQSLKNELAALFPSLTRIQQNEILSGRWDAVKSAALALELRKLLDEPPEGHPELRDQALRRLYELDPAAGRNLILADIERPEPRFGFEVLSILPDETLPSVESAIVDNAARTRSSIGRELIARYGSRAILPRVEALHKAMSCEPALIAYFLRVDPPSGEAKLRQALSERRPEAGHCYVLILPRTARYYAGPAWEKVAIGALDDTLVNVKMYAAKALGEHGSPAVREPLFRAFEYWHNWWKDRPAQINDENRSLEEGLVRDLTTANAWQLEPADLARLDGLCLTPECHDQVKYAQPGPVR